VAQERHRGGAGVFVLQGELERDFALLFARFRVYNLCVMVTVAFMRRTLGWGEGRRGTDGNNQRCPALSRILHGR